MENIYTLSDLAKPEELTPEHITQLRLFAHTVRLLSIDAVQKANSGHPGMPLGMADVAAVLWMRHLKHNPSNPGWFDRDRFVLSAGHGSMLLYSLLHLTGYDLPLSEIRNFRQWNSKTPGHPEYGHTPGVEITTGPLGQGISTAVGMALGERILAEQYNKPNFTLVDHYTYVIASDGDLMEGISHEACSLAGHLGLGKLIVLYDDNNITIDGSTDLSFSETVLKRFDAYGWHTREVDGHNMTEVDAALREARQEPHHPSLIACRTTIGYGSPNRAGTAKAHGEPLGEEEVKLTRENLGFSDSPPFHIPPEVSEITRSVIRKGQLLQQQWDDLFHEYVKSHPESGKELQQRLAGQLPEGWEQELSEISFDAPIATRAASGAVLNKLVPAIPRLIGGSADLSGSNNTLTKSQHAITRENTLGRYIHYGVREHAMGAMMNGLALHGGFIPYGGTFLVFSDYMRPAIRLAAMMGLQVIYVFTHDSIGLGEDGPTHQPVEHLTALRSIPNLTVIRPADAPETAQAWKAALANTTGPTALVLTRQKLPVLPRGENTYPPAEKLLQGAYIVKGTENAQAIIIASGSELHIALQAHQLLKEKGINTKVVSMPSTELFDARPQNYKALILPPRIRARVAVEAGVTSGWHKYVGDCGEIIGLDHFGASAPYQELYKRLEITPEAVADAVQRTMERVRMKG